MSDELWDMLVQKVAPILDVGLDWICWHTPRDWQERERLATTLSHMLAHGAWPRFVAEEPPILSADDATAEWMVNERQVREIIRSVIPTESVARYQMFATVKHGRLPIGFKVHSHSTHPLPGMILSKSAFRVLGAEECIVLPTVGNLEGAERLFTLIKERAGYNLLDNPEYQIQVCSPGRLDPRHAAILGTCYYLGSDTLRRFSQRDLVTTHSETGGRLVIYDGGIMQRSFPWWGTDDAGNLAVENFLPGDVSGRTDVLAASSLYDIDNINLVATLLVHAQHEGYWEFLGKAFAKDVENLLAQHELSGLLDAPWVLNNTATKPDPDGSVFFALFSELMAYAFAEKERVEQALRNGDGHAARSSILFEMHDLLETYRAELAVRSPEQGE